MNIESFKIFSDLAQTASFSQTARLNGISQSAVSQQVRALEKILGVTLINRKQKQFTLTGEGQILQKKSKDIFSYYEKTLAELRGAKDVLAETVSVAIADSVGRYTIMPRIKRFMGANLKSRIQLNFCENKDAIQRVSQGSANVGIIILDKKIKDDVTPLFEEQLVAICSPKNAIAHQKDTSLQELRTFPFVAFSEDAATRKIIDAAFRVAELDLVPARSFNNIEVIKAAVELDEGVALVPLDAVRTEASLGSLRVLRLRGDPVVRTVVALTKKGVSLSPLVKMFIEAMSR